MGLKQKLQDELKALLLAMAYFGIWLGFLALLKTLILTEYHIEYSVWTKALVGVLVLAKVVLILEHVSLGLWVRKQPAWVNVLLRSIVYAVGVFVVMLLEKAFEGRHEYGGFRNAFAEIFQNADMPHLWANTICLFGALLGYNILSVIRAQQGAGWLFQLFVSPLPEERESNSRE